ncbi:MAG: DUF3429 domain-containing protein [Hyphomicrobium sp.]
MSATSPARVPALPLAIGIAGLIPFVGLAGIIVLNPRLPAADAWRALTLYGAVILSFMGGVHWGLAMARGAELGPRGAEAGGRRTVSGYIASVVPALAGWFAVAILPPRPATSALALGFGLLLIYDLAAVGRGDAPVWYAPLRRWLTAIVLASLATALLATWR